MQINPYLFYNGNCEEALKYYEKVLGAKIGAMFPYEGGPPDMSLTLHFHPLSSFCWKALIALYENDTPFAGKLVNLQDDAERAA